MKGLDLLEGKVDDNCKLESICLNGSGIINMTFEDGTQFEIHAVGFKADLEVVKIF